MRTKTNTEYYGKVIAKKRGISFKKVHQILITCNKRIIQIMKEGDDISIPDCIDISVNKKARINYFKKAKEREERRKNNTV
jgi:hypothetical protein